LTASRQIPVEADPSRVGPYLIDRRLGAGGMGTVYLASPRADGNQAPSRCSPRRCPRRGVRRPVRARNRFAPKAKNPHVVELFDQGVDGDMHYYAMEYVEGETLTARLRREKRLPVARGGRAVDPDLHRAQGRA
jgi:serine/threonine protein kinase